jgi:hypothetical protein
MDSTLIQWILAAVFTVAWGSLFYQFKKVSERSERNENRIIVLEEKIWSKKDLEQTVEDAVEKVFLRWEINQLRKEKESTNEKGIMANR